MPSRAAQPRPVAALAVRQQLQCSFCGKDSDHVRFLCAGVFGGTICDRCCLTAFLIFLKAYVTSPFRLGSS